MLYVVHTIPDQKKRIFKMHKPAFQAFKAAARQGLTAALWHSNVKGKWTIVHHTNFYPTTLTEPYLDLYDSNKGVA